MNTIAETQVNTSRGRPAKATSANMPSTSMIRTLPVSSDLKQHIIELEALSKPKQRSRPATAAKPTPDATAEARKQEREVEKMEYKAEMHKYLKERLNQGKAKLRLENFIKHLESKIKSL
jgi:hypothetical protein